MGEAQSAGAEQHGHTWLVCLTMSKRTPWLAWMAGHEEGTGCTTEGLVDHGEQSAFSWK